MKHECVRVREVGLSKTKERNKKKKKKKRKVHPGKQFVYVNLLTDAVVLVCSRTATVPFHKTDLKYMWKQSNFAVST